MKKLILILPVVLMTIFAAQAQQVSAIPANFTAEDEVKLIVNVRGTALEGIEPLFIWSWRPADPVGGNGEWTNSNPRLQMTKEAANVWSITFVPTEFYGRSPGEIAANGNEIHFLVKARDGSGNPERKTQDLKIAITPLTFAPSLNRNFPGKVTPDDAVTLFLDQKMASDPNLRHQLGDFKVVVAPVDAGGAIVGGQTAEFDCRNLGDGVHSGILIPTRSFGSHARNAIGLRYYFVSKRNGSVRSPDFTLTFVQ